MKRLFWMALLLVAAGAAFAAGPGAVRKRIESSLLVKGTIDISAEGKVLGYALERDEALPAAVQRLVARAVPMWQFEPVELKTGTTRGRARMSLRLVARKLDEENFSVAIQGAQFGQEHVAGGLASKQMAPPRYPEDAQYAGVGGTVYLAVKVGRDGRVEDVTAEQVNLRVIASEPAMQRWRDVLEKASVRAARKWTFTPPTAGEDADAPYWSARVPVAFIAPGAKEPRDDEWSAYIPGPRRSIPWYPEAQGAGADALAAGDVQMLGAGPRLLTALDPG